jgi:serine/threonine protein kinase
MLREQTILNNGTIVRGRYKIVGVLGKGGFSVVYKVKDLQNEEKLFALKTVTYSNRQECKRFLSESEILKQLDHPAIPKVEDVFDDDKHNRASIVMNYVEGTNLEKLRRQKPEQRFSQAEVLQIMAPILDAVAYLHRQVPPVIHRDIKSANIIVRDAEKGSVLVDFGIAKEYETDGTTTAIRYCTPGFSAPEQYTGGTEARSDIYGLAATIYLLLTGIVPVDALQRLLSIHENEADPLVPINKIEPGLDSPVVEAIQCALSLSKYSRYVDVEQFKQALQGEQESFATSRVDVGAQFIAPLHPLNSLQHSPLTVKLPFPQIRPRDFQPKKRTIGVLLLVALLFCFIGTGLLFSANLFPGSHAAMQKSALSSSHGTNGTKHITSNGTGTSFPTIVGPYEGKVQNIAANLTTTMMLTVQQQNQGNIRGSFMGLQVKSSFNGKVDTAKTIQFTVEGYAGHSSLSFEGLMHSDGNIAGSFCSQDQSGKCIEYGIWSITPSSSALTQTNLNGHYVQPTYLLTKEKAIV